MPLYIVKRRFGAGTQEVELEAAGHRSAACVPFYEGMRWLQTFWDAELGETTCIYQARNVEEIRLHAQRASIPCDDVREVTELPVENFIGTSTLAASRSG